MRARSLILFVPKIMSTPLLLAYTKPTAADYIHHKWEVSDYHAGEITSRWIMGYCVPGIQSALRNASNGQPLTGSEFTTSGQAAYLELLPEWPEDIADYTKATDTYENNHTSFWVTTRWAWRVAYAALRCLRKHGRVTITGATEGLYLLNCSPAHHITFTGKGLCFPRLTH